MRAWSSFVAEMLRHGLKVTEMTVPELPGNPNAVWTVETSASDKKDYTYIFESSDIHAGVSTTWL